MANGAQEPPKGSQRESKSRAKGSQRDKTEFITKTISWNIHNGDSATGKSIIYTPTWKVDISHIRLVMFCNNNEMFSWNPNIFSWSIRSIWYHYFGLNIQEMTSTVVPKNNILINQSCLSRQSFEGVCETHVILTPGTCGSGAPNSTWCHHFSGTRGPIGTVGIWMRIPKQKKIYFAIKTMNFTHGHPIFNQV